MARINIEDEFWADPRRARLMIKLGCEMKATGAVIHAWKLAEQFWVPKKELIPLAAWEGAGMPKELFDCGFAQIHGTRVYVAGCDEHFSWRFTKSEAGKMGGEKSAKGAKRTKSGKFKKRGRSKSKQSQADEPGPSTSNPLPLSHTHTHTLPLSPSHSQRDETLEAQSLLEKIRIENGLNADGTPRGDWTGRSA